MPPMYSRLRLTVTLALALGAIALSLLPISRVNANGPHVETKEVFSGPTGPYDIRVFATPKVGYLHITTFVSPLGSPHRVTDAKVQVSGQGPQSASQTVGPTLAALSLNGWHGATLLIEEAGEWVFTVTVESPLGKTVVDIPIEVQGRGNINWVVIGAVAFFIAVATWLTFEWGRRKVFKRKPE